METTGYLAPTSPDEVREAYEELQPAARDLVREILIAVDPDGDVYRDSDTEEVVETAQHALFGSLLVVSTGSRERFDTYCQQPPHDSYEVRVEGSENVEHVAWHTAPVVDQIIATTYHAEREVAVSTLRRIAWGRIYHELIDEEPSQ